MAKIVGTAWFIYILTSCIDGAGKPIESANYSEWLWLCAVFVIGFSMALGYWIAKENGR